MLAKADFAVKPKLIGSMGAKHARLKGVAVAAAAQALAVATNPLGPLPEGADVAATAAWTVVGNVLLNLDELLMKP